MIRPPLVTRDFLLLVGGHFLQALGFSSMVLLPVYVAYLGASRAEIGAIMAVASIGGLVLRPLAGWALDAIGRRPTVVGGTVMLAVGMALIGLVDRVGPLIYVARVAMGIGAGTLFTAYFTFAADLIPAARRTEGIALFGVSGLVPLVINPVADGLGVSAPDLRWFFVGVGGVVLLSLGFVLALREPALDRAARPRGLRSVQTALVRRSLAPVWFATVVFAGLVALYMAFSVVVAAARGIEDPASMWFTYAAGAAGVRLFGGRLPERLGPRNLVAPALACYAGALLVAAGAEDRGALLASGLLAGVGHGYCFPVLTAQVVDRVHPALRGSGLAMFTALWEASGLALTPLFGALADVTDDATMFAAAALFALLGLATWAALEHGLTRALSDLPAASNDPTGGAP